jgi:hypothetical protein
MRTIPRCAGWVAIGLIALVGCGDDEQTRPDLVAPAAVTDLAVVTTSTNSVVLQWTASGDDGASGTARGYDLRYRAAEISDATWAAASVVEGEPSPHAAGASESFTIGGLVPATSYAFGLQVIDEKGNISPISNIVIAATLPDEGIDANWWDGFDVSGASGPVYVLHVHDQKLIAGGAFTQIGASGANHAASWDGSVWSPLGSGTNGDVWAMTTYGDDLVVGGFFTVAGEEIARFAALWDGSAWSALGGGMDNAIYALAVWDGQLVAGGEFHRAGDQDAAYLARWDGGAWHPIPGLDDAVYTLAVYQGDLIAGGRFLRAGGEDVHQIARWNGTAWTDLAGGMFVVPPHPRVVALAAKGTELVAGGHFSTAGDVPVSEVARWDGVAWSPMAAGANDIVLALGTYRGMWIAGGWFDLTGSTSIARVARFDGTQWVPLGSGIGGTFPAVYAIAEYNGDLYFGGAFDSAGGRSSINLARWRD